MNRKRQSFGCLFLMLPAASLLSEREELPLFFANNAGVLLEGGDKLFVGNAKGYIRLNLAMPRAMLEKGLRRMAEAVKNHRTQRKF